MTSPPCLSMCQHHPSCCATRTKSVAVKLSQRVTNFRRSLQASKMQKWVFSECSHQVATMYTCMEDRHWIISKKWNEAHFRNVGGVWVGKNKNTYHKRFLPNPKCLPMKGYDYGPVDWWIFPFERVWLCIEFILSVCPCGTAGLWRIWGKEGTRGKDRTPPHFSNHCSSTS